MRSCRNLNFCRSSGHPRVTCTWASLEKSESRVSTPNVKERFFFVDVPVVLGSVLFQIAQVCSCLPDHVRMFETATFYLGQIYLNQVLLRPILRRANFYLGQFYFGQVRLRPCCILTLVCVCFCVFVCVLVLVCVPPSSPFWTPFPGTSLSWTPHRQTALRRTPPPPTPLLDRPKFRAVFSLSSGPHPSGPHPPGPHPSGPKKILA